MKITNNFGVPAPLVALAQRNNYTKGKAQYSVTELIGSPRVHRLREKHKENLEQDVSDMIWSMMGSALHVVAENSKLPGHMTEERLLYTIDGTVISGAIDLQIIDGDTVDIVDYKFTSAWSLRADKVEWHQQQNIYAFLVEKVKKAKVRSISICALIRDWSRRDAANKADYPPAPIQMLSLPLWEIEDTEKFIKERIQAHKMSKVMADFFDDKDLPACSDEERWIRGDKYAVMKEGRKTAVRVYDSIDEANTLASTDPKLSVVFRKGEPIRCAGNFCGVAKWCSQYQNEIKESE